MLTLDFESLALELKDGAVKHVGASNTAVTAKGYDIEGIDVREFGDERVKLGFEDGEGNAVEVALFPEQAREIRRGIETIETDGTVFE